MIDSNLSVKINNDISKIGKTSLDSVSTGKTSGGVFEGVFNTAVNMLSETNQYQKVAEATQMDFVTGKSDDILAVMMSQEKAFTALNFATQITTKVMSAYREIMQVQL